MDGTRTPVLVAGLVAAACIVSCLGELEPTKQLDAQPPGLAFWLSLKSPREAFRSDEPIAVDVYVTNETGHDRHVPTFHPVVGLPVFAFVEVNSGREFWLPPGLYSDRFDAWGPWYQPDEMTPVCPAGGELLILRGDLREMVVDARDACARALKKSPLREGNTPVHEHTRREYQQVVEFARAFISGGEYEVRLLTVPPSSLSLRSNVIRIRALGPVEQTAELPNQRIERARSVTLEAARSDRR